MQGPLKTVIRNKTDKSLVYPTFPRIYIQPMGEFLMDCDPFTRWKDNNTSLEALLVDVRLGRAQIVYMIDPLYAVAGNNPGMVQLSANAERRAAGNTQPSPVLQRTDPPPKQPERKGVPFGKLPGEAAEPTPKTGAITDGKSDDPAAKLNAEVISKVAAAKPDTIVDLSKEASKQAEEAVTLTPINDADIEAKEVAAKESETKTAKRGGRKKKEVVQL